MTTTCIRPRAVCSAVKIREQVANAFPVLMSATAVYTIILLVGPQRGGITGPTSQLYLPINP